MGQRYVVVSELSNISENKIKKLKRSFKTCPNIKNI